MVEIPSPVLQGDWIRATLGAIEDCERKTGGKVGIKGARIEELRRQERTGISENSKARDGYSALLKRLREYYIMSS
ncbi:hypothetical protein TB1_000800 [Malus domestica]